MEDLFVFLIAFVTVFTVLIVNYFIKKHHNELAESKEITLLIYRFKLKHQNLNYNKLGLIFVLVNSLIIASVGTLASMINAHYIWQLLAGFVLLMILIYIVYGLIGTWLLRKGNKNGKL